MRKLFIFLVACFCLLSAQAAYLRNIPMTVTQPDGTVLHCFASGDEYFNYLHDENGYTIIQHPKTGYYVYAEKRDGKLVATDIIAGRQNPASKGLKPYALISPEEWMARRKAWEVPDERPINRDGQPNHGTLNNIAIFIRFSDDPELTNSYSSIDNMFNDVSDGAVSLRSYFRAASYGSIEIPTTFYPGHDNDNVISYQDTEPRSYFEPYSSTNTNGYDGDEERTEREHALLERAVEYINEYYPIPTSLNIDYDNDGYVDNICFIVKGGVGAWSSLLWPHMWSLYTRSVYINGKRVGTFNFQLADATGYFNTSTMCHEMNHSLGAPDLYHYSYSGPTAVGSWDLMCSNSTPPQHCGAYMKMKYGHWVDDIPEITQPGVYTLNPISSDTPDNIAYKIASADPNQFYVLEYRDKTSLFEAALPGSGLLIYRIDTRFNGNASYDPDNGIYDEVYIFRPGGSTTAEGTLNKAHFSYNTGRTEFSASTDPHPFLTDGTEDSDFRIYDITTAGSTISFTYGGASTLCGPPTNVTATINDGIVYLSWDAADHAQSYNVYRNGELIGNATGTTYTDSSVSIGAYSYYLKSVDIEGLQSAASETVTVSIVPEGYIYIGDGSTTNDENLPSHSYYRYSLTQQIYTSEELGWGGTINGIALCNEGDTKTRTLDLYLKNTKKNTFSSSNDWETVADSDKVFSGSVTMTANEWTKITFDTPFVYDGTSNIVLVTDDNTGSWTNAPHMSCRVFSASNKAIYLYSDGINYDPSDPSSYSGYVCSKKNQIFLQKDDDIPTYTVSVSADPSVGGTVSGGGTYSQGELCTVEATPKEGYLFKYWTIDGLMISSDASYTFTVTEDVMLVANFTTNSYQVTATPIPVEGGIVAFGSKNGSNELVYDFDDGTSQGWTLLKGPNGDSPDNWMHCADYTTENFVGEGHNESNGFMLSESYIFDTDTGVTPDNYLVSPKIWLSGNVTFWVTNLSNEYGAEHFGVAVSTSGNTNVNDFTTVEEWTLPIKKTGGTRTLENGIWNEYSVDLSDYQTYGYIAIRHFDCYYQWLLCVDDITITVDDGSATATYIYGTSCTVTATPNEGYYFENWTKNGYVVSTDTSYTFTVTEAVTLNANFSPNSYQVTVTPIPVNGGTVAFDGKNGRGELVYDFDDGTSQGWTLLKGPNGDSPDNWMHCADYTTENFVGEGHNESNGFMLSESYIFDTDTGVTPDNYLVSPKIWLSGNVTFWVTNLSNEYGAEHFGVAVSTSGNTNVNDFTTVQEWTLPIKKTGGTRTLENGIWNEYSVDLSDYQSYGYIAIRHFDCYYQWLLCVDDITIEVDDGSATATYLHGTSCTVTATPYEGYTFKNWTENGEVVSTDATYTFAVTSDRDLVANFEEPMITQTTELAVGLNWWTANVGTTLADLEAALGENGLMITDPDGHTVTYAPQLGWGGNLKTLEVGKMYKIKTSAACEIELTGVAVNPSEVEITLNHGINWIGFMGSTEVGLTDALSNLTATEGDAISGGGNKYATYSAEYGWGGNLKKLVPGAGYIYNSKAEGSVTFTYSVSKAYDGDDSGNDGECHWTAPAPSMYANRNHATYRVNIEGEDQTGDDIEVAAFIGDEVRGRVRLIEGKTYLTVFGNPEDVGQAVSFKAYDHATGEEYGICHQTIPFSGEEEVHYEGGTPLCFSQNGNDSMEEVFAYQNGSDVVVNGDGLLQIFDMMGRVVNIREIHGVETISTSSLQSGVYILRMVGEDIKTQRIVVR